MTIRVFFALLGTIGLLQFADDLLTWSPAPAEGRRLRQYRMVATAVAGITCAVGAFLLPGTTGSVLVPFWQLGGWVLVGTAALSLYGLVRDVIKWVWRRAD